PGLKVPRRISIQWVAANPTSPGFQVGAEAMIAVSQINHMMFNPYLPLTATAMQLTVGPHAWEDKLKEVYDLRKSHDLYALPQGYTAGLAWRFAKAGEERPATVAFMIGSAANAPTAFLAPLNFEAAAYTQVAKTVQPLIEAEYHTRDAEVGKELLAAF